MSDDEARTYVPHVVFVDESNRVLDLSGDPGQLPAGGVGADVARMRGLRSSGVPFAEARR